MTKKRIAALVSGGGTNLQAVLDAVNAGRINGEVSLVISSNTNAFALTRAENNNIPAFVCALKDYRNREARDSAILEYLREYKIDLVILAGYLGIISENILTAYAGRIINVHPALLPAFGGTGFHGLKVHEAALERGVRVTGATVHFVDGGVDTGKIILQKAVEVREDDTPETLQKRVMADAEHIIFPEAVRLLCEDKIVIKNGRVHII